MNKTATIAIVLIASTFAGVVFAPIIQQYLFPAIADIIPTTYMTVYVENVEWTNGSTIDWGTVTTGETYYYNFTIQNVGNTQFTAVLYVDPFPNATVTWTANNTLLAPTQSATGNLTLTIAVGTTATQYASTYYPTAET